MTIPQAPEGGAAGLDSVDGSHGGGGPHHRHPQQHAYHGQHYHHYHHGKRTLQRAANLLTSRGQPRPELKASLLEMSAAARGKAVAIVSVRGEVVGEVARKGEGEGEGEGEGNGADVRGHGRSRSEGSAGVRRLSSLKRTLMSVKEGASASLASGVQTVARSKSWRFSGSKAGSGSGGGGGGGGQEEEQHAHGGQKRKGHARSMSDAPPPRPRLVFSPDGSDRAFASNSSHDTSSSSTDVHPAHILRKASTRASTGSQMSTQMSPVVESPSEAHARAAGPVAQPASIADVAVPQLLQQGTPMIKVSAKKQKRVVFRLDPDQGQIIWEGKKHRIIPIENIKELRSGADARYYREQFQLSQDHESRWLTIIYTLDGQYKTWHVVAPSRDVYNMWDLTLRKLYAVRQALMTGLGNVDLREAVWEKQYWKGTDDEEDQRLYFEDVETLCKRLNINPSREDLLRRFQQADVQNRGFLDFADFQRFVKLLKTRPELERLYKKLCASHGGTFNFGVFEYFMREHQKSTASEADLERIFAYYTGAKDADQVPQLPIEFALKDESASQPTPSSSLSSSSPPPSPPRSSSAAVLTLEGFTSFLLSTDNSAFADQNRGIHHDMTRPLSEYYISSSHNTYLVGHQLVGVSTVEGYIRALLHSCRSVELDIYDGDAEPVIYHGKTLTSKVALREVCQAIAKYAFVVSPYPIIISAEVHCGIPQQEMLVAIMREVFGDALVSAPPEGRPKIEVLPSPEELKGRVLLKAKNLYVSESEGMRTKELTVDTESTTTSETSSTDSEVLSELKQEFNKARHALSRHRPSARRPSSASSTSGRAAPAERSKARMSLALVSLLVYTVGVKCRGLNKKEQYAPEHVFSLSENTANKMFRQGAMADLIKHTRTHVVRVYPKGLRLSSSNYEPHRYWSAGAQLVAINWQTFDLGYMINHAMFQRNGRSGYVLKPLALRSSVDKDLLGKRTKHFLDVTIISAQQLPRPKDAHGREVLDKSVIDPFVEVSVHVPDWTQTPFIPPASSAAGVTYAPPTSPPHSSHSSPPPPHAPAAASSSSGGGGGATTARVVSYKTGVVKNNGFNPVWEEALSLPFDCVGGMRELVFVRFAVREEGEDEREPLAVHCVSLGSLQEGFRHLPLHDAQLSQYLFSTLFVQVNIRDA